MAQNSLRLSGAKSGRYYPVILVALFTISLLTRSAVPAAAQPDKPASSTPRAGSVDPSFGEDGLAIIDFGDVGDYARDMVLAADGKIVVAGYSFNGATDDFALVRLNLDGSPDNTFSDDGKVTTEFGGNDQAYGVVIDSQGRIIIAGETDVAGDKDVAVARYNLDGSPDLTFSGDGRLYLDSLNLNLTDYARAVTVDASDKIVIAGYADNNVQGEDGVLVLRFNETGTLDATFGVRFGNPEVNNETYSVGMDVKVDAAGRILTLVRLRRAARYTTSGEFDTTFDGNGVAAFPSSFDRFMEGIVAAPGGKVLSAGSSHYIARLNSDGSEDISFSGDGQFSEFSLTGADSAMDVAIDSLARIVTAGFYTPSTNNTDIAVTRLDTAGNIDTYFGDNGVATFDLGTGLDSGEAVAVDNEDNILVAGYTTGSAANVDFVVMRLLSAITCADVVSIPVSECDALTAVYNATGGLNWDNTTDWFETGDPCTWYGVTCAGGNVIGLTLTNNNLSGSLPTEIGDLTSLTSLDVSGNILGGEVPASLAGLNNLQVGAVSVDYNSLTASSPGVIALLDAVNPTWAETQTVPPTNVQVSSDGDSLIITWTPILYQADGGYYRVKCTDGTESAIIVSINKAVEDAIFSGLPDGIYTCGILTFTPAHPNNKNDLTSLEVFAAPFNYGDGQDIPPNDPLANPIIFDGAPQQNYSLQIANATRDGDPLPPVADPDCPVSLTQTAVGIHYRVPGDAAGLNGAGAVVINAGGPIWFSNRAIDGDQTADTAIVIYEETGTNTVGAVVGCDDDDAPGEISISNAKFDLDPAKNYRVVVWNEAEAAQGAIVEIRRATFDLFAPADDLVTELAPATFTWQPYPAAVSYYLTVGLTTDISTLTLAQRTPAADSDELTCTVDLCTLTVAAGSPLDDYLNNGNYLWSVAASLSDTDPTIPLNDSNQVFRFVIGIETPNLLTNGSFETDNDFNGQPDSWTGKNLLKDKLKCNKPDKVVAYQGTCAYQFKGGSGENASLVQNIDGDQFSSGEQLQLSVQAKGKGFVTGTKITLKVSYTDGSKAKSKIGFGTDALTAYTLFTGDPLDLTAAVSSAKLKINHQNPTGKLILDDLWLTTTEAARSHTLPLPPDASNPESGLGSRRGG